MGDALLEFAPGLYAFLNLDAASTVDLWVKCRDPSMSSRIPTARRVDSHRTNKSQTSSPKVTQASPICFFDISESHKELRSKI
jgi:hypothetical protein